MKGKSCDVTTADLTTHLYLAQSNWMERWETLEASPFRFVLFNGCRNTLRFSRHWTCTRTRFEPVTHGVFCLPEEFPLLNGTLCASTGRWICLRRLFVLLPLACSVVFSYGCPQRIWFLCMFNELLDIKTADGKKWRRFCCVLSDATVLRVI